MTTAVRPWVPLAAKALHAARRRDHTAAAEAVVEIARVHTGDVMPDVVLAWIDTALHAQGLDTKPTGLVRLAFGNIGDPESHLSADDVAPEVAWAGRLMMARLVDDKPGFEALINAAITTLDDAGWGRHVLRVLDCCALTCNHAREAS